MPDLVIIETDQRNHSYVWYSDDCITQFCAQLDVWANAVANGEHDDDEERPSHSKVIVLAHNFQGYDRYPIIDYYHQNCVKIHQVRNGGKVLELKVGKKDDAHLRFIDSMSFLPMPLERSCLELEERFFSSFLQHP